MRQWDKVHAICKVGIPYQNAGLSAGCSASNPVSANVQGRQLMMAQVLGLLTPMVDFD